MRLWWHLHWRTQPAHRRIVWFLPAKADEEAHRVAFCSCGYLAPFGEL